MSEVNTELEQRLAEASSKFDTTPYGDDIIIKAFMDGSSMLIEVSKKYGDDEQKEFLDIVEQAKIFIRNYFEEKGWEVL